MITAPASPRAASRKAGAPCGPCWVPVQPDRGNHERGSWLAGLSQQASSKRPALVEDHIRSSTGRADRAAQSLRHLTSVALVGPPATTGLRMPCFSFRCQRATAAARPPSPAHRRPSLATLACPVLWADVSLWPAGLKRAGHRTHQHHRGEQPGLCASSTNSALGCCGRAQPGPPRRETVGSSCGDGRSVLPTCFASPCATGLSSRGVAQV